MTVEHSAVQSVNQSINQAAQMKKRNLATHYIIDKKQLYFTKSW